MGNLFNIKDKQEAKGLFGGGRLLWLILFLIIIGGIGPVIPPWGRK